MYGTVCNNLGSEETFLTKAGNLGAIKKRLIFFNL